jgi:hypothetical protein
MDKHERDEFEFKPLTEGLGFHKKVLELKEEAVPTKVGSTTGIMPQSQNLNKTSGDISKNPTGPAAPRAPITPLGSPLGWGPALKKMDIVDKPKGPQLVPCAASLPAALFDCTMVLGLALIFSAVVFATTGINYVYLMEVLQNDEWAQVATIVLFVSVFIIYTVATRSFFGKTLGEWVFEYRLGSPVEQESALYPLQVAWRSLLIACTGFFLLPLISMAVGRDIPGLLSGVSLYAEKR